MKIPPHLLRTFTLGVILAAVGTAQAATYTFTGTNATSDWSSTNNFSPNTGVPGAGDTLVVMSATGGLGITGTTRTILNLDASGMTVASNLIGSSGASGATLNITGTLLKTNTTPGTLTIRNAGAVSPLNLIINQIVHSGTGGNLAFGSSTQNPLTSFTATTANLNTTGLMIFTMLDGGTATIQNLNTTAGSVVLRNVTSGSTTLVVNRLNGTGGVVKATNSQVGSTGILLLDSTGSSSFSGTLQNGQPGSTLHLVKRGSGVQTLNAGNTYTGNTTVTDGRLQITHNNGLGFAGAMAVGESAGTTTISDGGTVDLTGNLTVNEIVTLSGGNLINSQAGSTATLANGIAGIQFTSSGSAYVGTAVTISGGGGTGATATSTVLTGTFTPLGAVTSVTLTNGGSGYTDAGSIVVSKSGGGTGFAASAVISSVTLSGTNNTIGGDGNIAVASVIGGTGGFTKVGTGTATFRAAANTYSGKTDISEGTLVLSAANNNIANSTQINVGSSGVLNVAGVTGGFTLASGQSITGSGTIVGAFTVGSGATLAPGNSPGTLTFDNNLTLSAGSTSNFEINGLTTGLYDLVQGGSGSQNVTFDGTLNLNFEAGFATIGTVKIFDFETYSGLFSAVNSSGLAGGYTASFNALTGEVTVVPEPSTWVLLGLGLSVVVWRTRSRRRQL